MCFLLQRNFGFKTLEKLIKQLVDANTETDPDLRALIDSDVREWARLRNAALHEMAKLSPFIQNVAPDSSEPLRIGGIPLGSLKSREY